MSPWHNEQALPLWLAPPLLQHYPDLTVSDVEHACCAKKQMGSGSLQKRESGRGPDPAARRQRAALLLGKHKRVLGVTVCAKLKRKATKQLNS